MLRLTLDGFLKFSEIQNPGNRNVKDSARADRVGAQSAYKRIQVQLVLNDNELRNYRILPNSLRQKEKTRLQWH